MRMLLLSQLGCGFLYAVVIRGAFFSFLVFRVWGLVLFGWLVFAFLFSLLLVWWPLLYTLCVLCCAHFVCASSIFSLCAYQEKKKYSLRVNDKIFKFFCLVDVIIINKERGEGKIIPFIIMLLLYSKRIFACQWIGSLLTE